MTDLDTRTQRRLPVVRRPRRARGERRRERRADSGAVLTIAAGAGLASLSMNFWIPFLPLYMLELGATSDANALFWVGSVDCPFLAWLAMMVALAAAEARSTAACKPAGKVPVCK